MSKQNKIWPEDRRVGIAFFGFIVFICFYLVIGVLIKRKRQLPWFIYHWVVSHWISLSGIPTIQKKTKEGSKNIEIKEEKTVRGEKDFTLDALRVTFMFISALIYFLVKILKNH